MSSSSGPSKSANARRAQRRQLIEQTWQEHYEDLMNGRITLAEILDYDDEKLMDLAESGLRLLELGMSQGAFHVFRGLVLLDPWIPYFHYLLGATHEKLGRLDEAEREFHQTAEMIREIEPPPDLLAFALLGKGRVFARTARIAEALEVLGPVRRRDLPVQDPTVVITAELISQHLEKGESLPKSEPREKAPMAGPFRSSGDGGSWATPFMQLNKLLPNKSSEKTVRPSGSTLDLHQAAKYLNLTIAHVLQLAEEASLPAFREGDDWVFESASLARWKRDNAQSRAQQRYQIAQQKLGGLVQPRQDQSFESTMSFDLRVVSELDEPGDRPG